MWKLLRSYVCSIFVLDTAQWVYHGLGCDQDFETPLPMKYPRQEHWRGLPSPPPGDLPSPGIEPGSPVSPPFPALHSLTKNAGWKRESSRAPVVLVLLKVMLSEKFLWEDKTKRPIYMGNRQ